MLALPLQFTWQEKRDTDMGNQNFKSFQFGSQIVLCAMLAILTTACSSSTSTGAGSTTSGAASTAATIAISPSSVTLSEGGVYTFVGSGGTGTYTYLLLSGVGTIDFYSGNYTAPDATGSAVVEVIDSSGNIASANITVSSSSSTGTVTAISSVTGTLNNCAGIIGSYGVNNWQVNGTELRTLNDPDYFTESPINCTGLSLAGTVPSDATIVGVSVSIFLINQSSGFDGSILQAMTLINSNAYVGNTSVIGQEIPGKSSAFPTFVEGDSENTWGANLTPAIVNSTSFGVNIETYRGMDRLFLGKSSTVVPQVTIYYTE
jgi:hypothetical protein